MGIENRILKPDAGAILAVIRHAQAADAAALADLAARTFRETFAAQNTSSDMEAYLRDAFSTERVRGELAEAANTFLLAFVGGAAKPTGYAKLRTGTPDPQVSDRQAIEIERLYVDQAAIGHGLGAALMRACLDEAAATHHRSIWLGVWEQNPRAIEFYRRWGFETVGEHLFRLGSDDQNDLIMERRVAADE